MRGVPDLRVDRCNAAPVRDAGAFVLYWMIATRRTTHNFALDRALAWARELDKPLVVLEALRAGYPFASDRIHTFVIEGMADNLARMERAGITYYPYLEPRPGAGKGLLDALARHAAVVVTDDFPCFFLPHMVRAAADKLPVLLEQVDAIGLLPMRAADRVFTTAHSFRRFLQKSLPDHLLELPRANPLARLRMRRAEIPRTVLRRWPPVDRARLARPQELCAALPIDHGVPPAPNFRGGSVAARRRLDTFVGSRLSRYLEQHNEPERAGTSELSPYLHFGHLSVHQVFAAVMSQEGWTPDGFSPRASGSRQGYWGVSAPAEAFLDQLITWREVGHNMCHLRHDYDRYASLPAWAKETLAVHVGDERPHRYSVSALEHGKTNDPLWNAAQMQMVREGWFHNYMRILWGKKILQWSATPKRALGTMIYLMNKYSLDGRDPNSYAGYFWILGRYDRPWGPERPIFGKVRYVSSENTARKVHVRGYIEKYAP